MTVTFGSLPPAAFTRIVGAPSAASIFLCASPRLARELASHVKNAALPPASLMALTRALPRSYTNDLEFVRDELYPAFGDIINWHARGTRYGIKADSSGLLSSGEQGVQLTWMDAKVGD